MRTFAHVLLSKIEHYVVSAHRNLPPDARAELHDACAELGAQIDSQEARLQCLEAWAVRQERQRQQRIEKVRKP